MRVTRAKLKHLIKEELDSALEALNPFKTLAQHEPEDFEDPEEDPDALKATDVLGGEWSGPIDDEPAPVHPPEEYRREAIQLLASYLDAENINRQAVDAVAWQLYNQAMQGDTVAMEEPPKKKRFKFFDEMIREELKAYLEEEEKNNPWRICTSSVGREDKDKYEKCVQSIKLQNRGK